MLWETYEKDENATSVPESDQCKKVTKVSMKLGRCCRGRTKKKVKRRRAEPALLFAGAEAVRNEGKLRAKGANLTFYLIVTERAEPTFHYDI